MHFGCLESICSIACGTKCNIMSAVQSVRSDAAGVRGCCILQVKELARKKQKICALLLHPGTVDTDLSKPFQGVRRHLTACDHQAYAADAP